MKILLIYEMVPENTRAFVINDPTDHEMELMKHAAGDFVNCDNNDFANELSDMIEEGKFDHLEVTITKPIDGLFDMVIVFGFVL